MQGEENVASHVLVLKKRAAPQCSTEQALSAFLLDGKARRLSPKTLYSYRQLIGYALAFLAEQGVTTLAEITPTHLRLWFVHLQERDWKENSVHTAAVALRAFFNWCLAEELLTDSPLRKVKLPRRSKELLPAFSDDDVRALLGVCGDSLRDRALILLLLDTGVRASECVALNVADVSADGAVAVQKGKGNKGRLTFLGSQAGRAVRRWLLSRPDSDPADALWISLNSGERLTRRRASAGIGTYRQAGRGSTPDGAQLQKNLRANESETGHGRRQPFPHLGACGFGYDQAISGSKSRRPARGPPPTWPGRRVAGERQGEALVGHH